MKIIIFILLCFLSLNGMAQTYNPAVAGTTSNKPYAPAQATPTDARSYLYDGTNFVWRPYISTSEVLSYLNLAKYRTGQFDICVNFGGILSGGIITGGINSIYYFKNGQADSNLVLKISAPTDTSLFLRKSLNLSDLSNAGTARTNLGLGGMAILGSAGSGDVSGTWPNLAVNSIQGHNLAFIQNYNNLSNPPTIPAQVNLTGSGTVSISGTYPNLTIIGSATTQCLNCNADSLKKQPIDTGSVIRNNYVLSWDSVNRKWIVSAPGTGGGGSGTVTSVSFAAANGFTGSFSNPTTTPALTIGTSITGLLFGNGTAIAAATVSTPLTYSTGTLGIQVASASQSGALAAADFISFAAKQAALSGTGYLNFTGTTPSYLTPTQVTANLNLFTSSLQGLVPLSGGGTTNFLRADGTWAVPAGGGGAVSSVSNSDGTLTISPTTGAVVASLALGHPNTWTGLQTQPAPIFTGLISSGVNDSVLTVDPATGQVHRKSGTFVINFVNGLNAPTIDSVKLGGALIQNTSIGTAGFSFSITGLPSKATALSTDSVIIENAAGQQFKLPVPSGGSGLTGGGGFSPLFTNGVSGSTLTFTASNAAANTAFGNFTGSSAAAAFGKLPLAAMATGTLNTLIGYDGSGNPSGITVSTGLSLVSGTLTATATTPTFQQTLTAGSTLTTNNTINQATHNFIWSGGGSIQFDSTKYTQGYLNPVLVADSLSAFGNSIGLGANATLIPDSAYNGRLARNYQKTLYNHSISGIKIYDIIGINMATINPGHHSFTSFEGGLNDLRSFASANVFNAINNCFNAAIINQYLSSYVSGSDASITRSGGTWTTGFPINSAGFGKTATAAYVNNTIGAVASWTSPVSTSVALQISGQVGVGATVTVVIDGTTMESIVTANQVETGSYIPMARVYTGLSNATHSVTLTYSAGSGLFILDYLGTVVATPTMPFVAFDVPYLFFTSGTGAGSDTKIRTDTVNNRIAATVSFYRAKGWPVYEGKTNNFYTATLGVDLSSDSVHPNNTGHARIFQSATAVINASSFTSGTLVYSNDGHFYGQGLSGLNQIAYFPEINLQSVLTNGSTMQTNMSINGNGYSSAFSNFTTMSFDSMLIIKNTGNTTTAIVNVHGQFASYGATAAIQILSRNGDTTKGFQFVTGGGAVSISDLFNGGRNIIQIDSGYRTRFLHNSNSLTVNSSPIMSNVYIDGNRDGRAGYTPFKIDSGLLVSSPEKYAFENNGIHFYWTDRTGTRFQLDQQSGGGVTTVGAFSGSSIANGASISSTTITFGPADGTNPGMVTTGAQTLAGAKAFSGTVTFNGQSTSVPALHLNVTGSVPASPANGDLFYDGSRLWVYNGTFPTDLMEAASRKTSGNLTLGGYTGNGSYVKYTYTSASTSDIYTLPAVASTSQRFYIKNAGGAGSILTISAAGGENLYTNQTVSSIKLLNGQSCDLFSDGTVWAVQNFSSGLSSPLVSSNDLTAQTAAISPVTSYSVPGSGGFNTFSVGGYLTVTAVSLDVIQLQVTYTDETSTSRTQSFFVQGATTGISATGANGYSPMNIRAKQGTAITVATVLTTGTGSITYDVGANITQIY